jgi:predicted DNA-binding transcriptional regulator YafY
MPKTSARLLALLSLLQARRDWPGAQLAGRLAVSPRTVRRDVDRLRELGYPVVTVKGPDGGYRLDAGTRMPPLLFDDDQAVALAVALQTTAAAGAGLGEAAARALATVRQVMPARLRHRVETVRVTAVAPAPGIATGVLAAVTTAAHAREVLTFDLHPGDGPPRRAEPHHVVTRGGRWYLVAWDLDRADWRTFRVDRIRPWSSTGPRFAPREVPGGDVARFVTGRFRGAVAGADWPCRGTVVLDLPAATVAAFSRDGIVEETGPGRCRLTLGSWSWAGLAAEFGRFDAGIEVVGPVELREAFALLGRRFTAAGSVAGSVAGSAG